MAPRWSKRAHPEAGTEPRLRDAWETHAEDWVRWAREPGHDTYWRFHRAAFLPLVPPPGRLTFDVGCGEGRLSRDLRAAGHRVVALDASAVMARHAVAADPAIPVAVADAAALPFGDETADLAVAFMSLQDVDDMGGAMHELSRVLTAGGRLCIATVHPVNGAGTFESAEPAARFIIEDYVSPRRYVDRIEQAGLRMTFHSQHLSLEAYARGLEAAGFLIEAIREVVVPESAVRAPHDRRWLRIPMFLHLRARKPRASP